MSVHSSTEMRLKIKELQYTKWAKKSKRKSRSISLKFVLFTFLAYISVYGTLAIYLTDPLTRSLKDVALGLLGIYGIVYAAKNRTIHPAAFYSFFCFATASFLSYLYTRDNISLLYGFKITIMPMFMLFVGSSIAHKKSFNLKPFIVFAYTLLIAGWLIQNALGLDRLMDYGFVYGKNIRQFVGGLLRLPSTVGTPDAYALYFAILAACLQHSLKTKKAKGFMFIVSSVFVVLSTFRTAMILWFLYNLIVLLVSAYKLKGPNKSLLLAVTSFILAMAVILIPSVVLKSDFASTSSLQDRMSHWFINLQPLLSQEGLIGEGLGKVGAASMRTADLGYDSSEYSTDNQFFVIYQQVGLAGSFFFFLLIAAVFYLIRRNSPNNTHLPALFIASMVSCLVADTLEIFPYNVLFWLVMGIGASEVAKRGAALQ